MRLLSTRGMSCKSKPKTNKEFQERIAIVSKSFFTKFVRCEGSRSVETDIVCRCCGMETTNLILQRSDKYYMSQFSCGG